MRERPWEVGICGTFDVANYGDLLFPMIAESELTERLGAVTLHRFSYHARTPPDWPYEVTSVAALPEMIRRLDGLLIGGGFIVRFDKNVAPGYAPPTPDVHHPTGYWLTPALLALQHDVPLIWNAPGMHCNDIPAWADPLMTMALTLSRYVSVRDDLSRAALQSLTSAPVALVPDTGFRIPRLLTLDGAPSPEFARLRDTAGLDGPYILIQATLGMEGFVRFVKEHAQRFKDFRFLALPIGPVLGERNEIIDTDLPGLVRLTDWPDPLLIAELISRSEAVVGVSYHLFITALAAGVPVFTRQPLSAGKYTALQDFETIFALPPGSAPDVDWFLARVGRVAPSALARAASEQLGEHWDRIAAALRSDSAPTAPALNRFWQSLPGVLESAATREHETLAELDTQDRLRDAVNALAAARLQAAEAVAREEDSAQLLAAARADTDAMAQILGQRDEAIAWLQVELREAAEARDRLNAENLSLTDHLRQIHGSRSWRWLMRCRGVLQLFRTQESPPLPAPGSPAPRPVPTEPPRLPERRAPDSLDALTLLPEVSAEDVTALLAHHRTEEARPCVDVICFSIIDWEFRYQRPQQIMAQFAAHGHRVFYISISRFLTGGRASSPVVRPIADNLYEVQLAAARPPDVYGEVIDGESGLLDSLAALRRAYGISSALAYVMIASWTEVALETGRRWGWMVAYDCMDEWENFAGIKPAVVAAERRLADRCDLLIVTADRLERKWAARGRQAVLARNGVDYDFYSSRCRPNPLLADVAHPIVGYFGAIADWFDIDLLAHVARERPSYQFVLLGGVFDVDVNALKALPNVSLLGQQPYTDMPRYLYHFDACLIPFKINAITEATDPVKLYEYLSAGKPVVSTALAELSSCREHVYLADDRKEFAAQLDRALGEDDPERIRQRRRFAAEHTWADRYRRIRTALTGACSRVSIVVVTYNNVHLTEVCLASILRNTAHPSYEVIVVDNASTDGTPTYLRHMMTRHPEIRVVLNPDNRGFARANNQGLAQSTGDHLVLLNNDTIVPSGWLPRLLGHLRDPGIGLIGPVSNSVGNEAKVEVAYRTWGEMEQFAAESAWRHEGQIADIGMLAMFCVAMRRDAYDRVGPLDERFGLGMFEDDDYAQRMRACGYRVVCARDAFVHHVGQAAFRHLIARGEYDALFDSNRRAFEAKWNTRWTPHTRASRTFWPESTESR